ncbi:unnamed protein product [Diamesa tonsa]
MSKVPMMFRDWWDEYDMDFDNYRRPARTSRLIDQHFGTALRKNDLMSTFANTHLSSPRTAGSYYRPWGQSLAKQDSGSTINVEKNKYQIILDVQQFTPNEISVKIAEKFIIVEGKHEEKEDEHGYVSRHFTRKYMLPSGHRAEDVVSTLSSDGILTISAPSNDTPPPAQDRSVPITHVGPSRQEATQQTKIDDQSTSQPKIEQMN